MANLKLRCALLCFTLLLGGAEVASADSLTLVFNVPAAGFPPPGPAPWATLALSLNPDQTIDAKLTMSPGRVTLGYCFDIPGSVSGFSVAGLPSSWSAAAFAGPACGTAQGVFNAYIIDVASFGAPASNAQSMFDVTISRTGGFSSVNDIVGTSAYGETSQVTFSLTVGSCGPSGCASGSAGPATVAEPSTLQIVLLGLSALAFVTLRKFSF